MDQTKPAKTPKSAVKKTAETDTPLPLIAYRLNNVPVEIVPGPSSRDWMDQTPNRFAYRCIPMLIANQAGWLLLIGHDVTVVWDGRQGTDAITIQSSDGESNMAASVFGSGILTFTLPYLFRTPRDFNLIAQGPVNMPKDGVTALTGIVETDWAESTFTMNWMITRPYHPITFKKGEPICMITPMRRYDIEQFQPVIRDISSTPELDADYRKWAMSRKQFNEDLKIKDSEASKVGWQKHYAQGKTITDKRTDSHQNKLSIKSFIDETKK